MENASIAVKFEKSDNLFYRSEQILLTQDGLLAYSLDRVYQRTCNCILHCFQSGFLLNVFTESSQVHKLYHLAQYCNSLYILIYLTLTTIIWHLFLNLNRTVSTAAHILYKSCRVFFCQCHYNYIVFSISLTL